MMSRTALAALALLVPTFAAAQTPTGIELENATFDGETASGACGPAQVAIAGVDRDNPHDTKRLIPGWGGSITIQSGGKSLVIDDTGTSGIALENYAKLHCVATTEAPRLVLAAHCSSSYCLPINYTVIDPSSLRVLSEGNEDGCDAACAEKALGTNLPTALTAPLN